MAYSVRERTQEIGIRMALGATAGSVFRLVIGQALRLVSIGVAVGLAAAAALTRVLERLLFEVDALDPWTFAVTALVLLVVATVASYVPARRSMRLAPVEALQDELGEIGDRRQEVGGRRRDRDRLRTTGWKTPQRAHSSGFHLVVRTTSISCLLSLCLLSPISYLAISNFRNRSVVSAPCAANHWRQAATLSGRVSSVISRNAR